MTESISILPATPADLEAIRHVASLTWPPTFAPILSGRQLGYMLHLFYQPKQLQAKMENGDLFFKAVDENERLIGFTHTGPFDYALSPVGTNLSWKLHKLYVLPEYQGHKLGKRLLQTAIDAATDAGANFFVLNVNRDNPALDYYLRQGFTILETADFAIGHGFFMNDHVMGKKL